MSFADFFNNLKEARFGFGVIRDAIVNLYYAITANPDIQPIWEGIMNVITPVFKIVIAVLIGLCLIGTFFGHRLMAVIKFAFFFIVGFVLGVHFLAPIIPVVKIPAWIVGLVVALVSAVLYKFLYYVLFAGAIGYSSYILCYNFFFITPAPAYTPTRAIVCALVSVGVVILALVLRKYVEMLGTAVICAYMATMLFIWNFYNFTALSFLAGKEWIGVIVVAGVIGLLGLLSQFRVRKRWD